MNRRWHAILAAAGMLLAAAAPDKVDPPLRVSFRLTDGVRISGDLTEWDVEGFDGSFGRRRWSEVDAEDAWTLVRRVIDHESASDWVRLGRIMLSTAEGATWAERAFRRALQIDVAAQDEIDAARADAAEDERRRREAEEAAAKSRLDVNSPEARPWPHDPWPAMETEDQQNARLVMLHDAEAALRTAGVELQPIETSYFLVYTPVDRLALAGHAVALDKAVKGLNGLFGRPAEENPFWGRAPIFVHEDHDRFRLAQAASFNQMVAGNTESITNYTGAKAFISVVRGSDEDRFRAALLRETAHAYMHRYRSPKRLPAWAHEGFADHLAGEALEDTPLGNELRRKGLDAVRASVAAGDLFDAAYGDGSWPGPREINRALGALLIEFMLKQNRSGFVRWVNAVKAGSPWRQAMEKEYGAAPEVLLNAFVQFYRVND
jgi:hypothetical protein